MFYSKYWVLAAAVLTCASVLAQDLDGVFSGVWHDSPIFAESECYGLLLLFPDGTFAMQDCSRYSSDCEKQESIGHWQVSGDALLLSIDMKATFKGSLANEEWLYCSFDQPARKETFDVPKEKILPHSAVIEEPTAWSRDVLSWRVTLDGIDYWKVIDTYGPYCAEISIASRLCSTFSDQESKAPSRGVPADRDPREREPGPLNSNR